MAGPRAEKVAVVDEVRGHLEEADAAILTEYRGLKVGDLATLRRALRAAGAEYKIYKNTLVQRATADSRHAVIGSLLEGPTAIAFVEHDVAAAAKVLREFARTHPALVVKGSFVGSGLLDAQTTNALADLPSREVLLAQIAGALAAPMRQLAGLLKALPQSFAYGLSALIDQRQAGGELLPAAEPEPEAVAADAGVADVPLGGETSAEPEASTAGGSQPAEAPADQVAPADEDAAAEAPAEAESAPAEAEAAPAEAEAAPAEEAAAEEPAEAVAEAPPEAAEAEEGDTPDESAE
ncbi:MAG TPA: 50S ribosomal protein L10 [Acidimicrobiales bacterium]|nr:50S ribosomal protein L10 [Acidimicrobiales bacterium]